MREGTEGLLWSGPDTPLFTLNDLFRGAWRRSIVPDGTLFAYAMNNYWHTNYAASQGGCGDVSVQDFAAGARRRGGARAPRMGGVRSPVRQPALHQRHAGPVDRQGPCAVLRGQGTDDCRAKAADDGEGVVVKLLDVAGSHAPSACGRRRMRSSSRAAPTSSS